MELKILAWIGAFSYPAVFLLLLACGLGAPLSEDLILVTGGMVVSQSRANLGLMMAVAWLGVVGGDFLLYRVGHALGPRVYSRAPFNKVLTPERVARVQTAFARHGGKTVFIARFTPGFRAPTFLMAGVGGFPLRRFLLADGLAAMITAPLLTWLGHRFGRAVLSDLELASKWILVAAAVAGVVALVRWLMKRKVRALVKPEASRAGEAGSVAERTGLSGPLLRDGRE